MAVNDTYRTFIIHIESPKERGKTYSKWLGDRAKPSNRDVLRAMIDASLAQNPASFDDLLSVLCNAGCEVKRGRYISLRGPEQKRFCRLSTLGSGYDAALLRAVLSGEKHHESESKSNDTPTVKINLLVDIQEKLLAGKGPGYERWAKVFNLKQMAQTLNYLSEMGLMDYNELALKTQNATQQCNELDEKIRAVEKRLSEITVLKTHIPSRRLLKNVR